ncbi:hypothetical protein LNQ81_01845 [Myroides sp. M-43]|uniref:hypothetical protein n=1 Tax=Myroides oncorhynchi TaxID=2893756 RepID=UPI001E2D6AB5|nr:hypothetical protein [Myroides oncorhynchi]MCC9041457.1 hypothetical protein [Myroides oncorhynchi]
MMNIEECYYAKTDWEKVEYIKELEWEDIDSKWDLYNTILLDEEEFDLARIEVLKILELYDIPIGYKDSIVSSLYTVLTTSSDDEVKEYAVMTTVNFMSYSFIVDYVKEVVVDKTQDIDYRYSAFDSLVRSLEVNEKKEILEKLLSDEEMKVSAERVFKELK